MHAGRSCKAPLLGGVGGGPLQQWCLAIVTGDCVYGVCGACVKKVILSLSQAWEPRKGPRRLVSMVPMHLQQMDLASVNNF